MSYIFYLINNFNFRLELFELFVFGLIDFALPLLMRTLLSPFDDAQQIRATQTFDGLLRRCQYILPIFKQPKNILRLKLFQFQSVALA